MKFEVFHHGLLGRPDIIAVDMIHYSGLWGLCFSHHPPHNNHPRYAADTTTAGVLRFLEAARSPRNGLDLKALANYTVTTHHVDADAVLPVWALLHPGEALERRERLEQVARCGDFFLYLEEPSARINAVIEGIHWRLRGAGKAGERLVDDQLTQACFDWLLPHLEVILDDPNAYREIWEAPMRALHTDWRYLTRPGRVTEHWEQHLSLVETDHDLDAHALNTACLNDLLLVWRTDTPERRLEVRPAIAWYELTSLPHRPRYALADLAERLNAAEHRRSGGSGPLWEYRSGPVSLYAETSRLTQDDLLQVVADWLEAQTEAQVSAAYRADVQEIFRFRERHATYDCHRRFAEAPQVSYRPGAPYGGLHFLGTEGSLQQGQRILQSTGGKRPLAFAVADDFYWSRTTTQILGLEMTYVDIGSGTFSLEYDTWDDPLRSTPSVTLCGDGQTKAARFILPDARFGANQELGADFRLSRTPGTPLALKELVLHRTL